jgi:dolichol-phosphate mannosyltransferase
VLQSIDVSSTRATGYGFQVELAYRARRQGAKIVEVPITFNDRVRGESKMSWHIIGEAMSLVTWWAFRDRIFGKLRRGAKPAGGPPVAQVTEVTNVVDVTETLDPEVADATEA